MERKLVMPEEVGFSTKCLERIRIWIGLACVVERGRVTDARVRW
jgi:hypothetical protein